MLIKRKSRDSGFSLLELLVAIFVLTFGVLGSMVMVIIGIERNNANRVDTTATNAAQAVLEAIAGTQANTDPQLTITDCQGNNLTVYTAAGGAPVTASGDIDFSQAAVANYQMNYTLCGSNGLSTVYDVRWRVDALGTQNYGKLVTVSARQPFVYKVGGLAGLLPVTLRTMVGI